MFKSKRVNLCKVWEAFSGKIFIKTKDACLNFLSSHENTPSERWRKNLAECDRRCHETMEEQTRNEICVKPNKCQKKTFWRKKNVQLIRFTETFCFLGISVVFQIFICCRNQIWNQITTFLYYFSPKRAYESVFNNKTNFFW